MTRYLGVLLLVLASCAQRNKFVPEVLTVCELSRKFPTLHDQRVSVRGVFYYGLREVCPDKCSNGSTWRSFIDLNGGTDGTWDAISKAELSTEAEAKKTKKRFEIWVTVHGIFHGSSNLCGSGDLGLPGYGHLGGYPAEIVVESFSDIEVKENPSSQYDYGNMYRVR